MERLEERPHVHIIFDQLTSYVCVELPRANLDFTFKPGQSNIHCKQYSNMVVDYDQQIGTLIGLKNKLVLVHFSNPKNRTVLIPEGPVTLEREKGLLRVQIKLDTISGVHKYEVDSTLGRLIDNGSLQAILYKCYMHAITSHCLPDPLTAHTGTEAALSILRSAKVSSFRSLTEQHIKLLQSIASLTPVRRFYPPRQTVVQQVHWRQTLPYMSQHGDFYLAVRNIFKEVRRHSLFYKDCCIKTEQLVVQKEDFMNRDLLQRDLFLTSSFRVDGFGAEHHTNDKDKVYKGRPELAPERARRSSIASKLIIRDSTTLHACIDVEAFRNAILQDHSCEEFEWTGNALQSYEMKFSANLLDGPASMFPHQWLDIYTSLTLHRNRYNRFDVMIWLATLGFASSADVDIIQALAFLYRNPMTMGTITIPTPTSYRLMNAKPSQELISKEVEKGRKTLRECPESRWEPNPGETNSQFSKRWNGSCTRRQQKVIKNFASDLLEQQKKTVHPTLPTTPDANDYLKTKEIMDHMCELFRSWNENALFCQHVDDVTAILGRQEVVEVHTARIFSTVSTSPSKPPVSSRGYKVMDIFCLENRSVPQMPLTPKCPDVSSYQTTTRKDRTTEHRFENFASLLMRKLKLTGKNHMCRIYDSALSR